MVELKIERRVTPSRWIQLEIAALSVTISLFVGALIMLAQGFDPIHIYSEMFSSAFGRISGFGRTITKFIPLLIVSLGLVVAYRARLWNIGGAGQMAVGAIAATGLALFPPFDMHPFLQLFLMFIAAMGAGAAWASISAYLNYKLGLNMVISTLFLNFIAVFLIRYLINGPWQGATAFSETNAIPSSVQLPTLGGTSIHYPTLIIGIVMLILLHLLLARTKLGLHVEAFGKNREAARYAGISRFKIIMLAMIISGALAGLAGAGELAGIHHKLREGITGAGAVYVSSYGYTAILVAWLGGNTPLGSALAAFFISGILVGRMVLQVMGLSVALTSVTIGLIFLGITGGAILSQYKIKLKVRDWK